MRNSVFSARWKAFDCYALRSLVASNELVELALVIGRAEASFAVHDDRAAAPGLRGEGRPGDILDVCIVIIEPEAGRCQNLTFAKAATLLSGLGQQMPDQEICCLAACDWICTFLSKCDWM